MKILKMAVGNNEEAYIEDSFSDGINILISDDNNKGKTIVIQSIMYALGNKPIFPDTFNYKDFYYYVEIEENNERIKVLRVGDSFIVHNDGGMKLFESLSEFKHFWDENVTLLPRIEVRGEKKIVDMELFFQLFFVPQDSKDTANIFNPGYYNKENYSDMIRSFAGDDSENLSTKEIYWLKYQIKELESKRRDKIKLSDFYKTMAPAKEYLSKIQDQEAFQKRVEVMDSISDEISEIRKRRKRLASQRALWSGTLKELKSLNRTIQVGELRCMDCDSSHIAYKGTGKMTYSFDVSTPEMRNQIIDSIEKRISAYNDEIERYDSEIADLQERLQLEMDDDDVTLENIVAYKNGIKDAAEIEQIVKEYDDQIAKYKASLNAGKRASISTNEKRNELYASVICELPDFLRLKRFLLFIIHKIDTLFTRPHLDLI